MVGLLLCPSGQLIAVPLIVLMALSAALFCVYIMYDSGSLMLGLLDCPI